LAFRGALRVGNARPPKGGTPCLCGFAALGKAGAKRLLVPGRAGVPPADPGVPPAPPSVGLNVNRQRAPSVIRSAGRDPRQGGRPASLGTSRVEQKSRIRRAEGAKVDSPRHRLGKPAPPRQGRRSATRLPARPLGLPALAQPRRKPRALPWAIDLGAFGAVALPRNLTVADRSKRCSSGIGKRADRVITPRLNHGFSQPLVEKCFTFTIYCGHSHG
jgi:hypothetical protein